MDIKLEKKFFLTQITSEQASSIMKQKINNEYYCSEDFKINFNQQCVAQALTLQYLPIVSLEAKIIDFKYDYTETHSNSKGYHGTISSSGDVNLTEDIEYWYTTESAEESGYLLKNDIVTRFIEQDLLQGEYEKIWKNSYNFLQEVQVNSNVSINNSDIDILSDQCRKEISSAAESQIKSYLEKRRTDYHSKTLRFNLEYLIKTIIYVPVYIFTFENNQYNVSGMTGNPLGFWDFRKNEDFLEELNKCEKKDKLSKFTLMPFVIVALLAEIAEIVISNIILFKYFLNPDNAEYYEPIAFTWVAIILGLVAYLIFGIGSIICAFFEASNETCVEEFNNHIKQQSGRRMDRNTGIYKKVFKTIKFILFGFIIAGINFAIVYFFMIP